MTTPIALPWDSPHVVILKRVPKELLAMGGFLVVAGAFSRSREEDVPALQ
jgi:hypothetical protein